MIKTVEVKNFQAHKLSVFDFSPGVNVIKGPSNQGKTAVIRAIKWALTNRPSTNSLKSWFSGKKDEIKVAIEFDDGYIIRKKDNDFNGYVLPTETFDAIGTNVPIEVDRIARMPEINLQSQHDPYFMIQEGPQAAAKKLNEIVGLTIIDEVLTNAVKSVNDRKKEIAACEEAIKSCKQEIESYDYLDELGKLIARIEKNLKSLEKARSRKAGLSTLSQEIVQLQNRDRQLKQYLTIGPKCDQLMSVANELKKTKGLSFRLRQACQNIDTQKQLLSHIEVKIVPTEAIDRLLAIDDKLNEVQSERVSLEMLHQSIVNLRKRGIEHAETLRDAKKQYQKTLSDAGICPTCGQEIPRMKNETDS